LALFYSRYVAHLSPNLRNWTVQADVADFVVGQVAEPTYLHRTPLVTW